MSKVGDIIHTLGGRYRVVERDPIYLSDGRPAGFAIRVEPVQEEEAPARLDKGPTTPREQA